MGPNTHIRKALQLVLLLVRDSKKIIVLCAAAAASGTFQKRIGVFKGLCYISFYSNLKYVTLSYRNSSC